MPLTKLLMQYYPDKICNWFEKLLASSGLADETVIPKCNLFSPNF